MSTPRKSAIEVAMACIAPEVHPVVPTVSGGYCMPILAAASRAGLTPLLTRSEAGAGMVASGIAWESGLATVFVTITSCGVLGAMQALSAAWINRIPIVLLSGECSTDDAVQSGDGIGGLSIVQITSPLVAWAAHIGRPGAVPGALLRAVRTATALRRPVHLSLPIHVCNAEMPS